MPTYPHSSLALFRVLSALVVASLLIFSTVVIAGSKIVGRFLSAIVISSLILLGLGANQISAAASRPRRSLLFLIACENSRTSLRVVREVGC